MCFNWPAQGSTKLTVPKARVSPPAVCINTDPSLVICFFWGAVKSERDTMSKALPESMIHCPETAAPAIGMSLELGFKHDFAGCPCSPADAGVQDFNV